MANLRLFWALEIGAAARARAAAIAAALREQPGGGDVRWVREESLHVTLRFLGAVDAARVGDLEREVADATRGVARFAASLGGLVMFPSPRRPRDGRARARARPVRSARSRQRSNAASSQRASRPEARPFRAHLHARPRARAAPLRARHGRDRIRHSARRCLGRRGNVLYRSDLAPTGSRYTPLARVPLHP
jgi:2'-5' RNA ligase